MAIALVATGMDHLIGDVHYDVKTAIRRLIVRILDMVMPRVLAELVHDYAQTDDECTAEIIRGGIAPALTRHDLRSPVIWTHGKYLLKIAPEIRSSGLWMGITWMCDGTMLADYWTRPDPKEYAFDTMNLAFRNCIEPKRLVWDITNVPTTIIAKPGVEHLLRSVRAINPGVMADRARQLHDSLIRWYVASAHALIARMNEAP